MGLAAPAPATITTSENTLGKSVPGISANVKATEVLQPIKASEGLDKSTPGVILESSSTEKTQIHTSAYPFILEEPHLKNALISSISILKELNPDSDFKVNLNEPKSKTISTIHIINHIHSGKGNVTKKVPKAYVDNFLNNSFDSILSRAVSPIKEKKWQNSEFKSKRINPTRTLSGDNQTEECANDTLSATDKSDKIIDQKGLEDKTKININSETSIKSEANVKDSHKDLTSQTPLSRNDSSVREEVDSLRRKAKVLDSERLGSESESALVQLQPGHDAPTASQGRVESLSSHVERNSANQFESHKSPLDKNSAINKEDDKIQSIVSSNNVLTTEKQEKKEDNKADIKSSTEGSAIINTFDKNILIKDTNIFDSSTTVKNVQVGVTPDPIKTIASPESELDRGLIALRVFQKLSELLDLNVISTNNSVVADGQLISKDKNIVSPKLTSPLKNIDDQKTDNALLSNSRGNLKFEKSDSSFSDGSEIDISKNNKLNKITQSTKQAKVTIASSEVQSKVPTPSAKLQTIDAKVTTPSTLPKIVDSKVTTPSTLVQIVETKVTTPSIPIQIAETKNTTPSTLLKTIDTNVKTPSTLELTVETKVTTPLPEVKSKDTMPSTDVITENVKLIKELESSTSSVPSFGTAKTYQDSSNFRQPSNVSQNKHGENQSINIQAKPLVDKVSNTQLDESTSNSVTPQQGRGHVTQTPAPTVQWIKITPPTNQTPAAKINNDENLEVQEANYLSTAAKNKFQSNNNYPYNGNTRVPKNNADAEKPLEESKFVKIIPTANQGIISAIPKLSQSFESSSEPPSYSSPKYIAYDNTPKSINDKETFSTPGPFSYSTVNNVDNYYYSRNPTTSPVKNNRQPTIALKQTKDSIADPQINTNINTGSYQNQRSRNTPTIGKISSSSDNGNIAQSRDAYKSLQEISLDTPKELQTPKDKVNVVIQTVSDGHKNAIRRVNPNAARNNNSFENVSPSNVPYTRGVNKYKSNRFDTISAFTTDSQINKLYTESIPTTKSQYNPVTQRSRSRVSSSTTATSLIKEEKNITDKRSEEKLVAAQKVSDTKGKYAVRTSRGNIKYVKNPHSGDWLGDENEKYPPQFSYK